MMRNRSLFFQITVVFLISFILTCVLVIPFVSFGLKTTFEEIVFEKLENESRSIRTNESILEGEHSENIAFIKYSSSRKSFFKSDNIDKYLDEGSVKLLVYKAAAQTQTSYNYINIINGKEIYYTIINHQVAFDIERYDTTIILTDAVMVSGLISQTLSKILIACLIAFIAGYLVVLLWVYKLVGETRKIAISLKRIGENYYQNAVTTKRRDEIGNLVDSVEVMRRKIVDNEKQKQEIIQGVSHDLKTPIAIIQSYSEALNDGLCSKKDAAKIIEKECKRLNKNVLSLLDITRVNYIETHQDIQGNIRLDQLINGIVKHYRHRTKAQIILNLGKYYFDGNKKGWTTIIENILDNAVRYAKAEIKIVLTETSLEIRNDGEKIDVGRIDKIFNLYEKDSEMGTGIGLYTVKSNVERFGYRIKAKNQDNWVSFVIEKPLNH